MAVQPSDFLADKAAAFVRWIVQLPRLGGRALVRLYRLTMSPLIGFHCRYLPTCSEYADEALQRHGLWAGSWMTGARLCRCHPWGGDGIDRVAIQTPSHARWYLPWRYGRWSGTNPGQPATDPASDLAPGSPS